MAGKSSRMEYHHDFERIIVLKVRKLCCEAYQKKLRKKLLKHEGVSSVEIQAEKSVVLVIGKVDPNSVVNIVARTGKHAEIVCCCNNSQQSCGKHSCCQDDHNISHKIQQEQQHKCEDYVPPPVDQSMCRDYWCRPPHSWRPAAQFSGHLPFRHHPRWFAAELPRPPPPGRRFYEYDYFH